MALILGSSNAFWKSSQRSASVPAKWLFCLNTCFPTTGCSPQLFKSVLACSISVFLFFNMPDGATMATVSPAFKYGGCFKVCNGLDELFCAFILGFPNKKAKQHNAIVNRCFDIM